MIRFAFCLFCLLSSSISYAATRYVTDDLRITMRSGPSVQNQITKFLNSGDKLELIEEDQVNGRDYAKVKTSDGKEGWVLTQYLTDKPVAKTKVDALQKKMAAIQESYDKLKNEMAEIKNSNAQTQTSNSALEKTLAETSAELAHIKEISGRALQLDKENKQLSLQLANLQNEYKLSRTENQALKDRSDREWFIKGAIVVIGSMLFGILLTRIPWKRRRSSWGSSL